MERFLVAFVAAGLVCSAAGIDRTKPPQTPPVPDIKMPGMQRFQLPNGLTVIASRDDRFPLTTIQLSFMAGLKYDPKDMPGLSESVAALLNQGTSTRSSKQIALEAGDLGAEITTSADKDALTLHGSCLSENLERFVPLFADVARNASFPEDEVALRKENGLQSLRAARSQANYIAREELAAALFGSNTYSHVGPTEQSLNQLSRAALMSFRDAHLTPKNAYLVPANKKQLILVNRPGSVQANIFSAHITPAFGPDYFALAVANRILGGGASSRLFNDIREKRGYAYDAHTEYTLMRDAGMAMAVTQVRNEVAGAAVEALNEDLKEIGSTRVKPQELSEAKASYAGRFILGLEQQSARAAQLTRIEVNGLPHDYLDTFLTHIQSVEPDQLQKAARFFSPEDATVVIVGDASKIQSQFAKFGDLQVVEPKR